MHSRIVSTGTQWRGLRRSHSRPNEIDQESEATRPRYAQSRERLPLCIILLAGLAQLFPFLPRYMFATLLALRRIPDARISSVGHSFPHLPADAAPSTARRGPSRLRKYEHCDCEISSLSRNATYIPILLRLHLLLPLRHSAAT
jgi:hypothetical protein